MGEAGLFFREFRRNFQTTGSIAPSSRWLARALASQVASPQGPRRVLEVGPGTGAVTRHIARRLGPHDRLDLVELNESFVAHLQHALESDPVLRPVAARTRVIHASLQEVVANEGYDCIVSGLPFNNFPSDLVREILARLERLARPGGTISFFEYVGVRPLRSLVCGASERTRLRGISTAIGDVLGRLGHRRQIVVPNVPPAWVHHLRTPMDT
jgi:phosphatidylethanolamine/phosphatidyl-N-methylethanolamine N-methyltransferase